MRTEAVADGHETTVASRTREARGDGLPDFHVVGIGASAGGLEALERFFARVPENSGMAFVVVQHLSPDFKSHMDELLGRQTRIPIRHVEDGTRVEPNHIYLVPARKETIISQGRLLLTDKDPDSGLTMPIDGFLRSLAQDARRQAVAVVLSGTGSDGSRGVKFVHDAGGLVIAQAEETARFDGMPLAAQETGLVDLILPPEAMPAALVKHAGGDARPEPPPRDSASATERAMERIFERLQAEYGIDFTHYKPSTVMRRTERRLEMSNTGDVAAYAELVERDREELDRLYRDLLIGVTRFFRDQEAYERLDAEVIPQILTRLDAQRQIRVWVAGCATGEEAYSIAMLFHEQLERSGRANPLKVFATDVHAESLDFASAGLYPAEAVADVREDRRRRYFEETSDGFRVVPELRETIVFAPHNVLKDAPFTKLELITCRNLLIYLQPVAQKKVLSLFHFGLRANGFLFLGPSETPGDLQDEFDRVSERCKIYRKRRDTRLRTDLRLPMPSGPTLPPPRMEVGRPPATRETTRSLEAYEALLARHMPTSLLIDEENRLVHTFGGAERFLRVPAGRSPENVLDMLGDDLRTALAGALQHARRDQTAVRYTGVRVRCGDEESTVRLVVEPLTLGAARTEHLLITLEPTEVKPAATSGEVADYDVDEVTRAHVESLEDELRSTEENLQATIEELETSNEELQAANEELVASNEELQSTNEELHSVNEELYTVNAEHQRKIAELTELTDDVNNLLESTEVGVVFLDEDLRIRKFTPNVAEKFGLLPVDVGRRIDTFASPLVGVSLYDEASTVLARGEPVQKEVADTAGHPYFLRVLPYRGQSTGGVLMTLIDVSELKAARAELRSAEQRYQDLYENAPDMYVSVDAGSRRVLECNRTTARTLGYDKQEIVGRHFPDLFHDDCADAVREALEEFLEAGTVFADDLRLHASDGRLVDVSLNASAVRDAGGRIVRGRVILRDVTESRRKDALIERSDARNAAILEAALDAIVTMDAEGVIVEFNPAAEAIFGYAADDAIGREMGELLVPERLRDAYRSGLQRYFATGEGPVFEGRLELPALRADGRELPCELTVTRIEVDDGPQMFTGFVRDLSDKVEAQAALRERENRFRGMFHNAAVGMAHVDLEGHWLRVNERLCQILGRSRHELLEEDAPLRDFLNRSQDWDRLLAGEIEQVFEQERLERDDGQTVWVSKTISVQRDPSDQPLYAIAVVQDITRQKQFEEELREAIRARESFLAMLSHELRNPLSAVVNAARMLKRSPRTRSGFSLLDVANVIERQSDQMSRLLRDLLDVSRIATGKIVLDRRPVDLVELAESVRETIAPTIDEHHVNLAVAMPDQPVWVDGDPTRLQQVQVNLLANAAKYSVPNGRILYALAVADGQAVIRVVDDGIGIPPETLHRIFEPFVQSDESLHRSEGGLGVGLTLVASLVELHGGTVAAHSEGPGRGSEFVVRLPLTSEPAPGKGSSAPEAEPEAAEPARPRRIVLVEDQVDNAVLLRSHLELDGHAVSVEHDGRSGLDLVLRERPEVVLLDIGLPDLDGYEVARRIRENENNGDWRPVVVALTGYGRAGDVARAREAGFDHHLVKPVNLDELGVVIASAAADSHTADGDGAAIG